MDNIKKNFSIRDLENISGIKAHTIRIWEKRYNLLSPERSKTNIRYYSHQNLQKLLNIVLLNNNNYKISKISKMSDELINITARDLALNTTINDDAINSLKLSMFKFDKIKKRIQWIRKRQNLLLVYQAHCCCCYYLQLVFLFHG